MKISIILWTALLLHWVSLLQAGPVEMVEEDHTEREVNDLELSDKEMESIDQQLQDEVYINSKLPKEIRDKFYGGDILLTPEQKEAIEEMEKEQERSAEGGIEKRAVVKYSCQLWPNGVVPYEIDSAFGPSARSVIDAAIAEFESKTCINFVQRTTQEDYVDFICGTGCYSSVGRIGGRQEISIGRGCETNRIVIQQIFHTLGRWHEHSRPDRDNYIRVNPANIQSGRNNDFQKLSFSDVSTNNICYDHQSVMHFTAYEFSCNGRPTIEPLVPGVSLSNLGERQTLTEQDLQHVLTLYCECLYEGVCPSLSSPRNGLVSVSTYFVNGRATYYCKNGYSLSGCSYRDCRSSGKWSGSQPYCPNMNECSLGIHNCAQVCTNTDESFYCSCFNGYRLNADQRTCRPCAGSLENVCPA